MPKNFFEELKWRGLIQDSTPGVDEELKKVPCQHTLVLIQHQIHYTLAVWFNY